MVWFRSEADIGTVHLRDIGAAAFVISPSGKSQSLGGLQVTAQFLVDR